MVPDMDKKSEPTVAAPVKKEIMNAMAVVKKETMNIVALAKKRNLNGVPSAKKEKKNAVAVERELMRGASGDEHRTSHANAATAGQSMPSCETENPDANLTDHVNQGGQDGDETEEPSGSESSFGNTFSGDDGASVFSEDEIDSQIGGGGQPSWLYPGYEEAFRKKKVTTHWRDFIRPLMVKCKWAELKMKQFQTLARMYDRILTQYDQQKQSQREIVETSGSKSLRFPHHHIKSDKTLRRKKRKRVEDTVDVTSYMLQHNLFSHYENKGTSAEIAFLNNGYTNQVEPAVKNDNDGANILDYDDLLEYRDEETSFERIFSKIDAMQARVHNLTARVGKVINENPRKFSLLNKYSLLHPSDSGPSTPQDPNSITGDKDKNLFESPNVAPQPAPEPNVEESNVPASVVTNELVVDSPLNIVDIADQPVVGNTSVNAEDEKPLKKRPIADDLIVYKRGTISAKKRRMFAEKQTDINLNGSAAKPSGVCQAQNEKSSLFLASRYSSLLNNQKKRGKRKGASSGKRVSKSLNLGLRS